LEVGEIPHLQGFTSMPVCASTTANKNAMVACEDQPPRSGLVQRASEGQSRLHVPYRQFGPDKLATCVL